MQQGGKARIYFDPFCQLAPVVNRLGLFPLAMLQGQCELGRAARCVMLPLCDVVHTQGRPPSLPMKKNKCPREQREQREGSPCLPCGIAALAATGSLAHQSFSSHAGGGWKHPISLAFRLWLCVWDLWPSQAPPSRRSNQYHVGCRMGSISARKLRFALGE